MTRWLVGPWSLVGRLRRRPADVSPSAGTRDDQRGFALVAALWVLLLVSILAASYSLTARTGVGLARNAVGAAEAEALADAGVHRVMAGLVATTETPFYRIDGTPYQWAFGTGLVRFTVEDESGKIDINTASAKLISALLQVTGVRAKDADAEADAIVSYRERLTGETNSASDSTEGTAPAAEDGTAPPSRSLAFALVEELLRVPGISGDLYRRVAPFITVYTGAEEPDENAALPETALALNIAKAGGAGGGAGVKQAELRARLEDRRNSLGAAVQQREQGSLGGGSAGAGSPRSLLSGSDEKPNAGNGSVLIHAEAMTAGGSVFVREAVVRLSLEQSPPYVTLAWRQGARWLFPLEPSAPG